MSFVNEHEKLLNKYKPIWNRISHIIVYKKFGKQSVYYKKYLNTNVIIVKSTNILTAKKISKKGFPYSCLAAIALDSVCKIKKG